MSWDSQAGCKWPGETWLLGPGGGWVPSVLAMGVESDTVLSAPSSGFDQVASADTSNPPVTTSGPPLPGPCTETWECRASMFTLPSALSTALQHCP